MNSPIAHAQIGDLEAMRSVERELHMPVYQRLPIAVVRAQGMHLWDDQGRRYLDFTSGLGVNVIGHCHGAVVDAVQAQAATLMHATNAVYTAPQLELAQRLTSHSMLDRVFFTNSGAESVECALKIARRWGQRFKGGAFEIVTARTGFHGRTLGALSCTGHPRFRDGFGPLLPGFPSVDFGDLDGLRAAVTANTAAVLLEPVQGYGGVQIATREYWRGVRELCDERDVLLIVDEVQSGLGRSGKLWAYEHCAITPDVMAIAKGLGGGLPIGACLATERASALGLGDHGSTFGGNPVSCAAANAVLQVVTQHGFLSGVQKVGAYLLGALRELHRRLPSKIAEVRGVGLWIGFQLKDPRGRELQMRCAQEGLLLFPSSEPTTLRLMPSLIVSEDDCAECLEIIERVLIGLDA